MPEIQRIIPVEEDVSNPAHIAVYHEGKDIKEKADLLFRQGKAQEALAQYYQVKLRWKGIVRQGSNPMSPAPISSPAPGEESKVQKQLDIDLEKLYSNMSACHLKMGRWQRTIDTADEALAFNKDNTKALFRKAKAFGELGYLERAEPIFLDLIKKQPSDQNLKIELDNLRQKDKEARKKADKKLKGFLNAKSSIFDEKTKPTITYEEDEKSDEEPSAAQKEKDRESQEKADRKLRGFLNKKTEIFDESTKPKITYEEDVNSDEETSARIEEVS